MTSPEEVLTALATKYAPDEADSFAAAVLRRRQERLARSGRECDRCDETKPVTAFSRDSRERDGLRRYCRECASDRYRNRTV